MKISRRTDTTSRSLMNIVFLLLHRLNTHRHSVQLTVLSFFFFFAVSSLSFFSFSLLLVSRICGRKKKRSNYPFSSLLLFFSSTIREQGEDEEREEKEKEEEKKKRLLLLVIRVRHLYTCLIAPFSLCPSLLSLPIFIIISMRISRKPFTTITAVRIVNYRQYVSNAVLFLFVIIRKSNWKRMNSRQCFRSSYLYFSSKTSTDARMIDDICSRLTVDRKICNRNLSFDFQ